MLRILGSPKKLCDGMTRRELLRAGGLGLLGALGGSSLRAEAVARPRSFGRAKSCILLYLYGAASQLEWCDPKPDAPVEVRGDLKSIQTTLPGAEVCELLPHTARVMDRVTVVRSLTHLYPVHGVAYALTGIPQTDVPLELNPRDGRHWPFVGSVVDYLGRSARKPAGSVPDNIALPFPFSSQRSGEVPRSGPYAAFLGGAYNPVWTTFRGKATRSVVKTLQQNREEVWDPYLGVGPEGRFEIATTELPAEITLDRLDRRRSLVEQFDQARHDLAETSAGRSHDRFREMAYSVMGSEKIRTALDLGRESDRLRETYGMSLFGQGALAARRLVEAGSRFVSVFWDEYGLAGSGWDTHWDHYPRLKNELLPGLDRAFSGLVQDLDSRGLLDETLVLCVTEHGRTPKLNTSNGGGRDHWSQAYSGMFAGGGIARGKVVGKTDKQAGGVVDRPVSPKDILATTYHLLGIDPHTAIADRSNRPVPLVPTGSVVAEMLG